MSTGRPLPPRPDAVPERPDVARPAIDGYGPGDFAGLGLLGAHQGCLPHLRVAP